MTGTVSAVTDTPGAYVLSSNGRNIDHDDRGFLFYNVPFAGDGELRLRVTGLSTLGENSNVGLMIRDSLDPGALYSTITFSTARFRREHILEVDGNPTLLDAAPAPLPVWLRMVRLLLARRRRVAAARQARGHRDRRHRAVRPHHGGRRLPE